MNTLTPEEQQKSQGAKACCANSLKMQNQTKKCCKNCRHWKEHWDNAKVGDCHGIPIWLVKHQDPLATLKTEGKTCKAYHAK